MIPDSEKKMKVPVQLNPGLLLSPGSVHTTPTPYFELLFLEI